MLAGGRSPSRARCAPGRTGAGARGPTAGRPAAPTPGWPLVGRRALSTRGRGRPALHALPGPPANRRAPAIRWGGAPFLGRRRHPRGRSVSLHPASGVGDRARGSRAHLAGALAQGQERLARGDLAHDLHVIPRLLDLVRRLDPREVGVVDHEVVLLADLAVPDEEIAESVASSAATTFSESSVPARRTASRYCHVAE